MENHCCRLASETVIEEDIQEREVDERIQPERAWERCIRSPPLQSLCSPDFFLCYWLHTTTPGSRCCLQWSPQWYSWLLTFVSSPRRNCSSSCHQKPLAKTQICSIPAVTPHSAHSHLPCSWMCPLWVCFSQSCTACQPSSSHFPHHNLLFTFLCRNTIPTPFCVFLLLCLYHAASPYLLAKT